MYQRDSCWNNRRRCHVSLDFDYDDTKRAGKVFEEPLVKSVNIVETRMYIS